jgi:hypothetical protein
MANNISSDKQKWENEHETAQKNSSNGWAGALVIGTIIRVSLYFIGASSMSESTSNTSATETNDSTTMPTMTGAYISSYATSIILSQIYNLYNNLDTIKVKVYLNWNDQFGTSKRHLLYSFNFDRKLFEKINWDGFMPNDLSSVTHNFHFSSWYQDNA